MATRYSKTLRAKAAKPAAAAASAGKPAVTAPTTAIRPSDFNAARDAEDRPIYGWNTR